MSRLYHDERRRSDGRRRYGGRVRGGAVGSPSLDASRRRTVTDTEREETGYAEAVRAAREAAGKDPGALAAALDMSWESYRDIETYDDELTSVVSFRDVVTLADLLELDLRRLFRADDTVATFADLAAAVRTRVGETPLEQFENEVGWELSAAISDPAAFGDFTLDGLADVAAPLGVDWRHLLPPSHGSDPRPP
jgi:ribosome-binding protein aMBF1 (putative translation factor)